MSTGGAVGKRLEQDNTLAVVGWGLATAVLLTVVAWQGLRTVGTAFGGVVLVVAMVLLVANLERSARSWTGRPAATRIWVVAAACTCAAAAPVWFAITSGPPHHHWLARALLLTAATATALLCLSSLVDWAYTHPRMRGEPHGVRPCRASTDAQWSALTRNWLTHRLVSYTIVRCAFGTTVGLLVVSLPGSLPAPVPSVLAGAAALWAAYVFTRVTTAGSLSQNPPLQVGDLVVLAEEYGTGVSDRPTYYVVDVSLEGVQLRELRFGRPIGGTRSHDRTLELKDVNRLLRSRRAYVGCRVQCSGVNKYCPLDVSKPVT